GLEVAVIQREARLGERCPALAPKLRRLDTLRELIIQANLAAPGPEEEAEHTRQLGRYWDEKDALEAELARQIPELELEQRLRAVDRRAVAAALEPASALVEFFRFERFDFSAAVEEG